MNFVIVTTGSGNSYAKKIARSISWINEHHFKGSEFNTTILSVSDVSKLEKFNKDNTIIHARAAHPYAGWMRVLRGVEARGYRVINRTSVLTLTSNKLNCSLSLQDEFPHPITWEANGSNLEETCSIALRTLVGDRLIVKPITSMEQGARVSRFNVNATSLDTLIKAVNAFPDNRAILQEYVDYVKLHRVIVIDGEALPYSFVDDINYHSSSDWKLSVCLNKKTMVFESNPNKNLLKLAEDVQTFINGEINFIDIFETKKGDFVIGEINTACNLSIHEKLAKDAGRADWNIHYRIARYLTRQI